jgi:DNA primase
MGADISPWQVEQILKFDRVYLALDNDEAGRRGVEICYFYLKNHIDVRLVPYLTKDPGECSKKKDWEKAFQESTDYALYSMEMAIGWEDYLDMRDEVLREVKNRG